MWSVERDVWRDMLSAKCEVLKSGIWSVWSVKCEVCSVWSVVYEA